MREQSSTAKFGISSCPKSWMFAETFEILRGSWEDKVRELLKQSIFYCLKKYVTMMW